LAQIIYSGRALDDLERLFRFIAEHDAGISADSSAAITGAIGMLAAHPLAGRRVEGELRELVISYGKTGFVALYRFLPVADQVRVLTLRHQRELDYPD
jgi:plasmid stabilization system protein ParE